MEDKLIQGVKKITEKFYDELKAFAEKENESVEFILRYYFPQILIDLDSKNNKERYNPFMGVIMPMGSISLKTLEVEINKRLTGYFSYLQKVIDKVTQPDCEQDDYYFELESEGTYKYDTIEIENYKGIESFELKKIEKEGKVMTFNTRNAKNVFEGMVKVFYKEDQIDEVNFYVNNKLVFKIEKEGISTPTEKGVIRDISHIKDINSFFLMINNC